MSFQGIMALNRVDFVLHPEETLGLIGPNGAGKTTLVNVLTGFLQPTRGQILLGGKNVTGYAPHRLAKMGVGRTFQNLRLFRGLTVIENVEAGALGVGLPRKEARAFASGLLSRFGLIHKAEVLVEALPHGDERRLGILRALATRPRFLLLDEPAAGLNELERAELVLALRGIRDAFPCAMVVIEHDMGMIMDLCERIQVLDYGKSLSVGSPKEVRSDPRVLAAYLGVKDNVALTET